MPGNWEQASLVGVEIFPLLSFVLRNEEGGKTRNYIGNTVCRKSLLVVMGGTVGVFTLSTCLQLSLQLGKSKFSKILWILLWNTRRHGLAPAPPDPHSYNQFLKNLPHSNAKKLKNQPIYIYIYEVITRKEKKRKWETNCW